jgi:hypothetical protein
MDGGNGFCNKTAGLRDFCSRSFKIKASVEAFQLLPCGPGCSFPVPLFGIEMLRTSTCGF